MRPHFPVRRARPVQFQDTEATVTEEIPYRSHSGRKNSYPPRSDRGLHGRNKETGWPGRLSVPFPWYRAQWCRRRRTRAVNGKPTKLRGERRLWPAMKHPVLVSRTGLAVSSLCFLCFLRSLLFKSIPSHFIAREAQVVPVKSPETSQ